MWVFGLCYLKNRRKCLNVCLICRIVLVSSENLAATVQMVKIHKKIFPLHRIHHKLFDEWVTSFKLGRLSVTKFAWETLTLIVTSPKLYRRFEIEILVEWFSENACHFFMNRSNIFFLSFGRKTTLFKALLISDFEWLYYRLITYF